MKSSTTWYIVFYFSYLTIFDRFKVDAEAERQGEILAFYGEEETRNYDSPEPGPVVEKDDITTKETTATDEVGQKIDCPSKLSKDCSALNLFWSMFIGVVMALMS